MRTATPQYMHPTQVEESDDEEYEPNEQGKYPIHQKISPD
mgnify:CR=1 FL=1